MPAHTLMLHGMVLAWAFVGGTLLGRQGWAWFLKQLTITPNARIVYYRSLITQLVVQALLIVNGMMVAGQPMSELGLRPPNWGSAGLSGAVLVSLVWAALLVKGAIRARKSPSHLESVYRRMGTVRALTPVTPEERRLWVWVSVAAGTLEELVFRGLPVFFFAQVAPGVPAWAVLALAGVGFGLAHSYQGRRNMVAVMGVGLLLGLMYWWSGSLFLSMALHTLNDIVPLAYPPPRPAPAAGQAE